MIKIQIQKEKAIRVNSHDLEQVAQRSGQILHLKRKYELSLVLVSEAKMRRLNQQYRGQNQVTDVLSFAAGQDNYFLPEQGRQYLGDIIICVERARAQAKDFKRTVGAEVAGLFVHGLLHLFGFDHKTRDEAKMMEKLTEKICVNLCSS